MGGYGSGGHNKTHRRLENFHRIDSFAFYGYLMADKYLDCKTTVQYPLLRGDIIYHVHSKTALIKNYSIQSGEYRHVVLPLSRVPGIDGKSVRMYFHCPYCGRRVRYLYDYYKHYACRKCAKLNYSSQQKSGMDEMRLKMERIVEKELGYTWWYKDYPNACISDLWHIPRPKYMRQRKYEKLMAEFRQLQKDYERAFWVGMAKCSMLSGRELATIMSHLDSL